ncbi:MAG: Na+/H+ antiporter NhaA [Nitrospinae bacterium]|nr:Na+/H+ antiporter NhaA [Nitrospinota bacterium]
MKTKLTKLFLEFTESEQASGVILILCAITAIAIANSPWGVGFLDFWRIEAGMEIGNFHFRHSVESWINEGLMTIFFLLIGLEIERELYVGELSDPRNALLPVVAAIGGMAVPALLHFSLNYGGETQGGAGIPMATDIAFALGALSLLGARVPVSLKIFLAALAIIDDLGAIIIIGLFYVKDFSPAHLFLALGIFAGLLLLNRLRARRLSFYLVPGIAMWYFMLESGIHATITGVILAFAVPFGRGDEESPSYRLQHFLHKPVSFLVMPLFALANTGVVLTDGWIKALASPNSLGILAGLFLGKPLGIAGFTFLAVKSGLSRLPNGVCWPHIAGAGFLGGIGFTMSIFITLLAFDDTGLIQNSKIAVLTGSLSKGVAGFLILRAQKSEADSEAR